MKRNVVPPQDALELFQTPPDLITMELLRKWLAHRMSGPPKYCLTDIIDISKEYASPPTVVPKEGHWDVRWAPNWGSIRSTTVGRFITNNLCFSRSKELRTAVPYVDVPWSKGTIGDIEQGAMDAFLENRIVFEDMTWVIDRMQWLGFGVTRFVAPSMSIDTIRIPGATRKLKKAILAGPRGDAIREGDLKELGATEKELLASAKGELEGRDPGIDVFNSGARGSFGNNFRNVALMRGAIRKSDDPSKITVSTASLEDGIPLAEQPAYADLIVQASFGRAISTAQGGYIAKQLNMAFQTLQLNPDPKSDCRTPLLYTVTIDNPREYLFRNYMSGGKLVEMTTDKLSGLKGQTVKMRSPLFCGDKRYICAKCAGGMYYRMGITNVGLIAGRIGTTLMNQALTSGLKRCKRYCDAKTSLIAGSPLEPNYYNVARKSKRDSTKSVRIG